MINYPGYLGGTGLGGRINTHIHNNHNRMPSAEIAK